MFKEKFERATPIVIDSALKALKCWNAGEPGVFILFFQSLTCE